MHLLIELTNDFKLAIELKDLISENIDKAYLLIKSDNSQSMILKEQIVHIRWHTIFDFWNELGLKIEQKFKIKVNLPSNDLITKTTHRNRKKGIDLNFTFNDIFIYVVNDRKGLTFGLVRDNQKDWEYFKFENSNSILFHDFDSIETFRIINSEYRNQVTDNIVLELGNKIEERVRSVVLKTNLISLPS